MKIFPRSNINLVYEFSLAQSIPSSLIVFLKTMVLQYQLRQIVIYRVEVGFRYIKYRCQFAG